MRKPILAALRAGVPGLSPKGEVHRDRLRDLGDFGDNPGNLRARCYVPARLADAPALVVVLHGCTQTAAAYDHGSGWSRLADRHGFALLYPEQRRANNANLCFNWFGPADIARGSGEAASIHEMVESMIAGHGIDRDRVFVTGLSAGGAMTSVMLAAYPETFAGGAIIAGLPYGCAANVQEAFGAMRARGRSRPESLSALVRQASDHRGRWPTISIWHGSGDATVNPDNAEAIVDQWLPLHGIAGGPAVSDAVDGYPHRLWRDDAGRDVVESYSITGMGHGTPLDAAGHDSQEAAGPHMLDVAISSTRRIAWFWGIVDAASPSAADRERPRPAEPSIVPYRGPAPRATPGEAIAPRGATPGGVDVRAIIESALRAGGLMR